MLSLSESGHAKKTFGLCTKVFWERQKPQKEFGCVNVVLWLVNRRRAGPSAGCSEIVARELCCSVGFACGGLAASSWAEHRPSWAECSLNILNCGRSASMQQMRPHLWSWLGSRWFLTFFRLSQGGKKRAGEMELKQQNSLILRPPSFPPLIALSWEKLPYLSTQKMSRNMHVCRGTFQHHIYYFSCTLWTVLHNVIIHRMLQWRIVLCCLTHGSISAFAQYLELHFGKPVSAISTTMRKLLICTKRSPTF